MLVVILGTPHCMSKAPNEDSSGCDQGNGTQPDFPFVRSDEEECLDNRISVVLVEKTAFFKKVWEGEINNFFPFEMDVYRSNYNI